MPRAIVKTDQAALDASRFQLEFTQVKAAFSREMVRAW